MHKACVLIEFFVVWRAECRGFESHSGLLFLGKRVVLGAV